MLYVSNGDVYVKDADGTVHPVDVTVKEKVIQKREVESVTAKPHAETAELPEDARPVTLNELMCKFSISEDKPLMFKGGGTVEPETLDASIAAPWTEGEALGKDVSTLMDSDVKILPDGHVTGTFPYVEGFEAFDPSDPELQAGNYFCMKLGSAYEGKAVTVQRTSGEEGAVKQVEDLEWVLRLTDGASTVYKVTADEVDELTLDFSQATLKSAAKAVRRTKRKA